MAVGIAGVNRTPGQDARTRRNFDKMGNPKALIDPNNAIQLTVKGKIVLVIATDEPFTQSSAGLVLVVDGITLQKTSGVLFVDPEDRYENIIYYG